MPTLQSAGREIRVFVSPSEITDLQAKDLARDIAKKIKAVYERLQNPATDPVINFDERDLLRFAEQAGFREIHLELNIEIKPNDFDNWDMMLRVAPNPRVPNLEEAMQEVIEAVDSLNHLNIPVELLPRGLDVIKMQQKFTNQNNLVSEIVGMDDEKRLRIYPKGN